MSSVKLLPKKHRRKSVTPEQDLEIQHMARDKQISYQEAKFLFFEIGGKSTEPKRRKSMTVAETKLGVTLVISKEECEKIGYASNLMTSEVIRQLRGKLGLGE